MPDGDRREESVNIGVIVHSPSGFKGGKFLTPEEIRRKCYQVIGDWDLKILESNIKQIQEVSNLSEDLSELEKLLQNNYKVRFTQPRGGHTRNPQRKVGWLFETFVALPVYNSTCR